MGRWRNVIVDWVAEACAREQGAAATHGNAITFCVEGNIGAGKSTYLDMVKSVNDHATVHEMVEVVPEPVDMWQDVAGSGENLLQLFYQDPKRYAFTFQQYVLITRIRRVRATAQTLMLSHKTQVVAVIVHAWCKSKRVYTHV